MTFGDTRKTKLQAFFADVLHKVWNAWHGPMAFSLTVPVAG
jgi:hypothetical protein